MILKSFGLYLLQKKYPAVWVVLLCAFLPFLQVPTFSIATTIVALVTLHKGAKEGFFLLCWMVLPEIAASFYGDFGMLLLQGLAKGVVVWAMGCVLARTSNWVMTMQSVMVLGVMLVIAFHLIVPDTSAWWLQKASLYSSQIQVSWNLTADQTKLLLEKISYFATGIMLAGFLALDIVLLLMARAWQALLFNPGGLAREWRQLRLSYGYSGILLAILAFIWLDVDWLMDVLPIVLMPFVFAGLSLLHARLPDKKNIRLLILTAFYMSMLVFLPYICLLLVFLAFLDSWFDFRSLRAIKK